MVSLQPPVCDFDKPAIDFDLPGVDGRNWTLDQCKGDKGLLVMFICNHCPYVHSIIRIDEVSKRGQNKILEMENNLSNVTTFPSGNFTPPANNT